MVPCHSFHIYGIWTGRSKRVWGMVKSHQLGVVMQVRALLIGKTGSHYYNTALLWNFIASLAGVYIVKHFIGYLFSLYCCFTCLRGWQSRKCNSKCPNDINTKLCILNPPPSPCVFFHYSSVSTVISDCNHPFDTNTFTQTVSQEYIYCNWKYISEWSFFEINNFYFSIKEIYES